MRIHSREESFVSVKPSNFFKERLTKNKKTAIIIARMVVASVESIFFKPSLPKIATKAANIAESKAYTIHISFCFLYLLWLIANFAIMSIITKIETRVELFDIVDID